MILLTGATGYLGTLVLARLLEAPGGPQIVCPVRAGDDAAAGERIDAALARIWNEPSPARRARVIGVAADLTQDVRVPQMPDVTHVLHCAAAVSFDQPLDEARAVNVDGTRAVIGLARQAPALERIVHVSTAYVAGRHVGRFTEGDLELGQSYRNTYEQTKQEAERLVAEIASDLPLVVARPSIVVGEADTGWTTSFNVLYPPLRAYRRGMLREAPATPDGLLDVVTGDYVADALLHLLEAPDASGTYNLVAGPGALTVLTLRDLAAATFGLPHVALTEADAEDEDIFVPYFDVRCRFDDARAREILRPAGIRPQSVTSAFDRLMAYADRAAWGKRKIVREDAQREAAAASSLAPTT